MNNIHGSRANTDLLHREGSGYRATHGAADFLLANDSWSQMLNFRYGPDGGVYAIDWYDKNQCHSSNPDLHQKSLGRIFKISNVNDTWVNVNLRKLSSDKLVELQLQRNDSYVRHARRILQERGPDPAVHAALKRILRDNPDVTRKLRALWALHVTDGLNEEDLLDLLGHETVSPQLGGVPDGGLQECTDACASPLRTDGQRRSVTTRSSVPRQRDAARAEKRWDVVTGLLTHDEDADDHNLPMMVWYAAEPVVPLDMPRALELAAASRLPHVFPFTVRRIAAAGTEDALRVLTDRLGRTSNRGQRLNLVDGITQIVGPR